MKLWHDCHTRHSALVNDTGITPPKNSRCGKYGRSRASNESQLFSSLQASASDIGIYCLSNAQFWGVLIPKDSYSRLSHTVELGLFLRFKSVKSRTIVLAALILVAYFVGLLVPQAHAWNLSSSPATRTTTPGGTVTFTISVFYEPPEAVLGTVQLLVSPPELGLTPSFSPTSGSIPFTSTLTVQVSATKAVGVYSLPVWAHPTAIPYPGPGNKAINVQVVVAAASTDWALSSPTLSPASPNVGDPTTFQVILTALSTSLSYPQSPTLLAQVDGVPVGGGSVSYPGPTGIPATVYSAPPWSATAGTHTIVWTVSSGVSDPNPSNNQVSRTFTVGPPPAQFDFEVLASPTDSTATPGSSTSYTIMVNLLSGSTQSVTLSLSGQPGGVSGAFSPLSGSPTFSSSLTLSVASSVSTGSYTMTVTGVGGGKTHTATIKLTVSQAPDFRIDVSPPSVSVSQGQVASYSVSISGLNGFNSQVSLSVSGAPAGVNPVFTVPSGTPSFNSILTVTLPGNVQTGSFTLQITASGGGLTKIANAVLVISAATGTQTQTQTQTETQTETTTSGVLPFDIFQQSNLLLIAVLAIVILALLALLLRRRKSASPPPPPANPCPKCGQPLTYVKEYDRWYCNNCKEYK